MQCSISSSTQYVVIDMVRPHGILHPCGGVQHRVSVPAKTPRRSIWPKPNCSVAPCCGCWALDGANKARPKC